MVPKMPVEGLDHDVAPPELKRLVRQAPQFAPRRSEAACKDAVSEVQLTKSRDRVRGYSESEAELPLGGREQLLTLAVPLVGEKRVAADDQPLVGEIVSSGMEPTTDR